MKNILKCPLSIHVLIAVEFIRPTLQKKKETYFLIFMYLRDKERDWDWDVID